MENSNPNDEILIRYLADDLSTEETASVENWINAGKSNQVYFEGLKNAWNLTSLKSTLSDVNLDEEWNKFKQAHISEANNVVPLYEDDQFNRTRKPQLRKLVSAFAIAASVLLVISVGWKLFF